jgi:hypothetical protein
VSYGLKVYDAAGALIWDSTAVVGGIIADCREFASGESGVFTYPAYAGRAAFLLRDYDTIPASITVDTTLGYPRVTVAAEAVSWRRFMLAVY